MKTRLNRGFTLIELLVVITIIAILAGLAVPAMQSVIEKGHMVKASNNAKQIVLALKSYSADNHGLYPDVQKNNPPQTSNDAFRALFRSGILSDERIFGCSLSRFNGDDVIGTAPDFDQALASGENHWAMTAGLTDASAGNAPLVFENPVTDSWPPVWDADAAGRPLEGRAWKSGRIIIARNDGSVTSEPLASTTGDSVNVRPYENGKDLFTQFSEQGTFLNIQK